MTPHETKATVTMTAHDLEALLARNAALEGRLRETRAESARWFAHAIALDKDDFTVSRAHQRIQARRTKDPSDEDRRIRRKRKWDCRLLPELNSREFQIGQKLVSCLNVQHVKIGSQLNVYQSFMRFVPARLGESAALSSAAACLNSAYLEFVAKKPELSLRSRRLYGVALADLRKTLMDADKAASSEGLCAAFFLILYEVMNGSFAAEHLRGIATLIRTYGLDGYKDDLGMALTVLLIPRLIIQALHSRKPCFLAEPAWTSTLTAAASSHSVCDHFDALLLLAHVATFLSTTLIATKANRTQDYDALLSRARSLRYSLKPFSSACLPLLKDEYLNAGEYSLTDACRAMVGVYAVMTLAVNLIIGKLHRLLEIDPGAEIQKVYEDENRILAALVQRIAVFARVLGPFVHETISLSVELVTEIMDEMNVDLVKKGPDGVCYDSGGSDIRERELESTGATSDDSTSSDSSTTSDPVVSNKDASTSNKTSSSGISDSLTSDRRISNTRNGESVTGGVDVLKQVEPV